MGVLGRLQIYVLTRTLAGLAAALVVIASVVMLISFVELSRSYGGRSDVGFVRLVELMLLQAPSIILLLLPFIFLFGTMAAFVTLNRRSELIAMRAAGVSAWRFIFPAAVAAFLIGVIDVAILNPIAAELNGRYEDAKSAIDEGAVGKEGNSAVWLRQGDEHTQVVIHAESHDMKEGVVHLQHVSLFLQNVTSAARCSSPGASRRTTRGSTRVSGASAMCARRRRAPDRCAPRPCRSPRPSIAARRWRSSPPRMRSVSGGCRRPSSAPRPPVFSAAPYRLRYQELLATPVLFAGMSMLAAAFSLRLMRLGGLAGLAGAGVALGFAIFFFDQLCGALGGAEVIPPLLAGWAPPVIALLAGFTLLCYTEDG